MKKYMKISILGTALALSLSGLAQAEPVVGETPENSLAGTSLTFASWGGILQEGQIAALGHFTEQRDQLIVNLFWITTGRGEQRRAHQPPITSQQQPDDQLVCGDHRQAIPSKCAKSGRAAPFCPYSAVSWPLFMAKLAGASA